MNFLDTIQPMASLIISFITLIGFIIAIYKFSSDPDKKNKSNLAELTVSCNLKHERIDEVIDDIKKNYENIDRSLVLIKENDLKHIENDIRDMRNTQTKILTILEYKQGVDNVEKSK